jgi:hypothetical protein
MIGDHHDRMPGGATLLVRAMDGILGTHKLTASGTRVTRARPGYSHPRLVRENKEPGGLL